MTSTQYHNRAAVLAAVLVISYFGMFLLALDNNIISLIFAAVFTFTYIGFGIFVHYFENKLGK